MSDDKQYKFPRVFNHDFSRFKWGMSHVRQASRPKYKRVKKPAYDVEIVITNSPGGLFAPWDRFEEVRKGLAAGIRYENEAITEEHYQDVPVYDLHLPTPRPIKRLSQRDLLDEDARLRLWVALLPPDHPDIDKAKTLQGAILSELLDRGMI